MDPLSRFGRPHGKPYASAEYTELGSMDGPQGGYGQTPYYDRIEEGEDEVHRKNSPGVVEPEVESVASKLKTVPTGYDPSNHESNNLQRMHRPRRQLMHLLTKVFFRWMVTFILIVCQYSTMLSYERRGVLTKFDKTTFNFVKTGLYLSIGLNVAGSFKSMALMLRWKLLSRKKHSLDEVDAILGLASLLKVVGLGARSLKKKKFHVFFWSLLWIIVNLIGRFSIALTGLCYSYEHATSTSHGKVTVSDLTAFSEKRELGWTLSYTHDIADSLTPLSKIIDLGLKCPKAGRCTYHFQDWTEDDTIKGPSTVSSDRTVDITSRCRLWPIISGGNGRSSTIVYTKTYTDGSKKNVTLESVQLHSPGATLYINPRSDVNPSHVCTLLNPKRCSRLAVIQFSDNTPEAKDASFYDCEVEVSEVKNWKIEEHKLPDGVAWMAAGVAGLTGFSEGEDRWEYVRYYKDSTFYGTRANGDPNKIANLTATFAANAIAALDRFPPTGKKITTEGKRLSSGVAVKIMHRYLHMIYAGILGLQGLLGIAAALWSNTVVVKDDSYLSTARLLRPIVSRLGTQGCALSGKDIAAELNEYVVYGVTSDGSRTRHHLDIGADILAQKKFPAGWYNGEDVVGVGVRRRGVKVKVE